MLRADAQDNRDRALEAARGLFAEHGIDVPMREIARVAEIGPATLYRRFPTKRDLIEAAFAQELGECRAIVVDGCADPDPWRGLRSVIERITLLNGRNHGFVEAFLSSSTEAAELHRHRAELLRLVAGLARRAQAAGGLRSDFAVDDLLFVLLAGRVLSSAPLEKRPAAARRFAALAIDALRASDAHESLPA
ncbi:TetR/AcrR family transcriptional regulator [Leifsonia sp. ZF2019]|uniref:TetR/AcrR family transcriptional regulator n=1 Tax=Leifsonia sp. ZF2019 TaxID=2781978 RepID=UPI001CBBEAF6|nr:TetR/AcrR family transcriptional regulator [Leifsonia sp. ZF2019]